MVVSDEVEGADERERDTYTFIYICIYTYVYTYYCICSVICQGILPSDTSICIYIHLWRERERNNK